MADLVVSMSGDLAAVIGWSQYRQAKPKYLGCPGASPRGAPVAQLKPTAAAITLSRSGSVPESSGVSAARQCTYGRIDLRSAALQAGR